MLHRFLIRSAIIFAWVVLLVGCASTSHTHAVDDGVYVTSAHRMHSNVRHPVILNPRSYPFWSIDFFYFSYFYGPMRTRALYNPPLFPSVTGPCDRWARHLCLEELYARHLRSRLRVERDDLTLISTGQEPISDHRLRGLSSGAELHLAHRVSEARRTFAARRLNASQEIQPRQTQTVNQRNAGLRERATVAHRSRIDRSSSLASRSHGRSTAARSSLQHRSSSSRGSAAAISSTRISEIEP